MKWASLIAGLAGMILLIRWLRRNDQAIPWLWMLIGIAPFLISYFHMYMAIISWSEWSGYVKGMEIAGLDLLAIIAFASSKAPLRPPPFLLSMLFYIGVILLSALQSDLTTPVYFVAWQFFRMMFLALTLVRACADPRVAPALLTGLAIGICFEAGLSVVQRFGGGALQAAGTFVHQNLLGLISNGLVMPFVAILLVRPSLVRHWIVPLAGLVVCLMTVSRATLGMYALGWSLLFLISLIRYWSLQKLWALLACLAVVAIAVPMAQSLFVSRFQATPLDADYDERAAFIKAATMMLSDHPLGVGANNYVVVVNTKGYNDKAEVAPVYGSRSANVHNAYILTAAETGYLGLTALVVMLLQPLIVAFRCGWRHRSDFRGDILIGLGVALLITYIHCFFEWVFVMYEYQYFYALTVGLIGGLAGQLGYWSPVRLSRTASVLLKPARLELSTP